MGENNTIPGFNLEALRNGSEAAFKILFDEYYQALCYFSLQVTHDLKASEEIAVDTLLKLWELRRDFDSPYAIRSFLYVSTRNASLNFLKSKERRSHREKVWASDLPDADDSVFNSIIKTEVLREIHVAISRLPEHYSKVLHLAYSEGLKSVEIAERLQLPVNTVDSQKARGIALLKKMLGGNALVVLLALLGNGKL